MNNLTQHFTIFYRKQDRHYLKKILETKKHIDCVNATIMNKYSDNSQLSF